MSHNNSICKFRNYSRDSSLAAHDFSTKFRRHLFYRGQPSPAFRDAESVRRQLSRGGRQTAAQKRGWGRRCGKRMPTAKQRWGCWQRHREVYGRRHREQLPMTARKGVREGHGERMPTATQRWGCRRRREERMPTAKQRWGYWQRHREVCERQHREQFPTATQRWGCGGGAGNGCRQQSGRFRFEFPAFFITLRHTY